MASDKKAKTKIPKRVAGVKVPKKLRKKANRALELADNPVVREAAAAALAAGAARLIAALDSIAEEQKGEAAGKGRKSPN